LVAEADRNVVLAYTVGPAYFQTVGAPLIAGREFAEGDTASRIPVIIVNRRFVEKYWPNANPLDKRVRLFNGKEAGPWLNVVGVASNVAQNIILSEYDPLIYVPFAQHPAPSSWFIVRAGMPLQTLEPVIRREVLGLEPELPVGSIVTMMQWFRTRYLEKNTIASMFLIFAAIALLLASIGLYAVVSHSVSQRTSEIGIRMAIGATESDIRSLVLRQGTAPVAVGLAIGIALSVAVNRLLTPELVQTSATDPLTLASVALILLVSATLGCWIPARRAIRIDPANALRA
jgi:putative ABC transport system permease protein